MKKRNKNSKNHCLTSKMKKQLQLLLKNKLAEKQLNLIPSSCDIVGDILIFSVMPKELVKKEKTIGV